MIEDQTFWIFAFIYIFLLLLVYGLAWYNEKQVRKFEAIVEEFKTK